MPTGTSGSVLVVIAVLPSPAGTTTDATTSRPAPSYRLTESSRRRTPRGSYRGERAYSLAAPDRSPFRSGDRSAAGAKATGRSSHLELALVHHVVHEERLREL